MALSTPESLCLGSSYTRITKASEILNKPPSVFFSEALVAAFHYLPTPIIFLKPCYSININLPSYFVAAQVLRSRYPSVEIFVEVYFTYMRKHFLHPFPFPVLSFLLHPLSVLSPPTSVVYGYVITRRSPSNLFS